MILNPDDHPRRYTAPNEAFAHVRRRFRDEVLTDPKIRRVVVMVGPAGSGKSTAAKAYDNATTAVIDQCHVNAPERRELASRIRKAGKRPEAVFMVTPTEECLRRNAQRGRDRRVPAPVIRRQAQALKVRPPRPVEGWASIVREGA